MQLTHLYPTFNSGYKKIQSMKYYQCFVQLPIFDFKILLRIKDFTKSKESHVEKTLAWHKHAGNKSLAIFKSDVASVLHKTTWIIEFQDEMSSFSALKQETLTQNTVPLA